MANKIGLFDNLNTDFYIGDTKARIYLGDALLYPSGPPSYMFTRTHLDGTVFSVECGESGTTLTSNITTANSSKSEITGTTNPATAITIGDCVTEIGNNAFYGWDTVQGELVIPESVKTIGNMAFESCNGFTGDLVIPDSVTSIGTEAFYGCKGFNGSLTIGSGVTEILDYAFAYCNGFNVMLTLPSNLKKIGNYAFYGCNGFTGELVIPEGITEIGNRAFYSSGKYSGTLTLPSSITSIGDYAFYTSISNVTAIYVKATTPPTLGNNAFYGKGTIYVPCESVDAYKSATNWSSYADRIVGYDFENDSTDCNGGGKLKDFVFNYNKNNYDSSTKTFFKTEGQQLDKDAVLTQGTVTSTALALAISNAKVDLNADGSNASLLNWNSSSPNMTFVFNAVGGTSNNSGMLYTNYWTSSNFTISPFNTSLRIRGGGGSSGDVTISGIYSNTQTAITSVVIEGLNYRIKNHSTNQEWSGTIPQWGENQTKGGCLFYNPGASTFYNGFFNWIYMAKRALTDEEIGQVIAYNEGTSIEADRDDGDILDED